MITLWLFGLSVDNDHIYAIYLPVAWSTLKLGQIRIRFVIDQSDTRFQYKIGTVVKSVCAPWPRCQICNKDLD